MQKTTNPLTINSIKNEAKLLKLLIGKDIKHGQALNLLSKEYGYKDWNVFSAALKKAQTFKSYADQQWSKVGAFFEAFRDFQDSHLVNFIVPAMVKWRESHPSTVDNNVYGETLLEKDHHIFTALLAIMDRSYNQEMYHNSIEEIMNKKISLFEGEPEYGRISRHKHGLWYEQKDYIRELLDNKKEILIVEALAANAVDIKSKATLDIPIVVHEHSLLKTSIDDFDFLSVGEKGVSSIMRELEKVGNSTMIDLKGLSREEMAKTLRERNSLAGKITWFDEAYFMREYATTKTKEPNYEKYKETPPYVKQFGLDKTRKR